MRSTTSTLGVKKILYILTLTLILFSNSMAFGAETIFYEDADQDRIQDNATDTDKRDKDPNTRAENVPFICDNTDISIHRWQDDDFISYGCENFDQLGVFSQLKKDKGIDSDDDGITDLYDFDDNTSDDNTKFVCTTGDIRREAFIDCRESDLGRFSQLKKDQNFDSDRDGILDFEDREKQTDVGKRNFVCTTRDIQRAQIWRAQFNGCGNSGQLWVFSLAKQSFILDEWDITSGWFDSRLGDSAGGIIVDGWQIQNGNLNLDSWNIKEWVDRNDPLRELQDNWDGFIVSDQIWERGIYDVLLTAARDLKNVFFLVATIFFLYLVIQLLLSENSEEDTTKFKKWILWITIWLVVMQLSFTFVSAIYDGWLWSQLWKSLVESVIQPLIQLLETLASFFFITMGIVAFYQLVTSGGEEQAATDAKTTVVNAIGGFLLVQLAAFIVTSVYNASGNTWVDPWEFSRVIVTIINWMNSFVGIAVIVMIIYTGAQVLLSWWEEEKITNAKKSMIYIVIWIVLLVVNFLILTFFFNPSTPIT